MIPASGRPVRADRTLVPAPSTLSPAGYAPDSLDETLRSYLAAGEKSIQVARALGAKVEEAVNTLVAEMTGTPEEQAELLTKLHERLTKACLNLVKSTDELSRLRSFLAGGPDSRPDLSLQGEVELRVMLVAAVQQLGWRVMDQAGVIVEVG